MSRGHWKNAFGDRVGFGCLLPGTPSPHGRDGWSARGLFLGRKDGKTPIGFYCYHMDMKGRYGSNWVWDRDELGLLENNRWYCIEQYVKLNAPGRPDGTRDDARIAQCLAPTP